MTVVKTESYRVGPGRGTIGYFSDMTPQKAASILMKVTRNYKGKSKGIRVKTHAVRGGNTGRGIGAK